MDISDIYEIIDEVQVSNSEERRHVERIHVLITTAIIASYFTPIAQSLILTQGIGDYTRYLVVVSVVYLAIRLVDITVPVRELHQILDVSFGVLAPLGFLVSVIGYLVVAFISILEVPITRQESFVLAVCVLLLSVCLAILQWQQGTKEEAVENQVKSAISKGIEFEEYILNHPEKIEKGLKWEEEQVNFQPNRRVDFVGSDADGKRVYAEAKLGRLSTARLKESTNLLQSSGNSGRRILITNEPLPASAKNWLAKSNDSAQYPVEVKQIDFNGE